MLKHVWIIFRRELAGYFTSPVAYLVAFAVLLLGGLIFNRDLAVRNGRIATDGSVVLTYFAQFSLFFSPLLTMRLMAEENREGTIELLMTLPVKDGEIVLGKFLGAWAYFAALIACTLVYQLVLIWLSPPDIGVVIAAYFGILLYGGATIAIGLLFSAITENQIVAAFLSTATLLLLWQADLVGLVVNNRGLAELVREISLQSHYMYSFSLGLVRFGDMVFFIAVIVVMLFATSQILESRRWR